MLTTTNSLNAVTLLVYVAFLAAQQVRSETTSLYLTKNESALLIPQLYIDQNIHTQYTIEGTSITTHQALETLLKYDQALPIAVNSQGESLIRMQHTLQDVTYVYYISQDGFLKYAIIKLNFIEEEFQLNLGWGARIEGMQIVNQWEVLIWGAKSMGVIRIQKNNQTLVGNIMRVDLPSQLLLRINECHFFSQNTYICFSNQDLIQIKQVTKMTPQILDLENVLQIEHIFYFKEELKCIVNVYRLENDLIGLCDCQQGCFNYKRVNNQFFVTLHAEIPNLQEILIMKLAEGGPKTVTMAVASQKILVLLRWGQDQIDSVESMPIPEMNGGEVWDIVISGDSICIKYRVQANPTIVAFQHIFIRYDTIRMQYYQLNIVLNSPYIFTFFRVLYSISENNQLEVRMTNPYYIMVGYEAASRNITIRAFNTGIRPSDPEPENETINILIVSSRDGEVYINKQLTKQLEINYQYSYPMELFNIFVGRAKQYIFTQQRIPLNTYAEQYSQEMLQQSIQNKIVIDSVSQQRILSINNMLQCVKLIGNGWAFKRVMIGPNSRIYVEVCKSQKPQNAGDFVCEIDQIIDTIMDKTDLKKWELVDVSIEQDQIQYELWRTAQPINKEMQLYQFLINTRNMCLHIITHKESVKSVNDRYLLITTHGINQYGPVVIVGVYDCVSQQLIAVENIPVVPFLERLDVNAGNVDFNNRITNIDYSLKYQNIVFMQYDVVVGYHLGSNTTIAIIMQLTLSKYRADHHCRLVPVKLVSVPQFVVYFRVYSHYLYSFNQTHVSKYSLMTFNGSLLYIHQLELVLDNPLKFVRNLGQYMLLVYTHSYRLLDLQQQILSLVIDEVTVDQVRTNRKGGVGNIGVNDMIIFGSGILLVGINNIMKAYDMNLVLTIGPYPISLGRIRTYHKMTLTAVPAHSTAKLAVQSFNLTITYETKLVEVRGKAIKMLRGIPYEATNQTIIIFENMFTGPIAEYYIADIYDGAIIMLNHMQQIYDDDICDSTTPLAINKWLGTETTLHLTYYSYRILLRKTINAPVNTPPQNTTILYTNGTHLILVYLRRGVIEADIQIPDWHSCSDKYSEYLYYAQNQQNFFLIFSNSCIIYFMHHPNNKTTIDVFQTYKHYGLLIQDISIGKLNGSYLAIVLFTNSSKNEVDSTMGYIKLDEDKYAVYFSNVNDVEFFALVNELMIYKKFPQPQHQSANVAKNLLCVQSIAALIGDNSQECHPLVQKISPSYYIAQMKSYYKLVVVSDTNMKQRVIRLLMLSKYYQAYHLELSLIIKQTNLNSTLIHWDWAVINCYASLLDYEAINFIGMYINQTGYDYFVLQYIELEDHPNRQTILAFYRVNYEYGLYCNYVSGWVDVNNDELAIIVDTFDPEFYPYLPHQSVMFTTLEVFHLFKNLTFILNYEKPSKIPYTVINAKNPSQFNKFYSKLVYEPDPQQKYLWMYCWLGFGGVALCLVILKVISLMIDRGIIRWTKSLSSDDDSGSSPGITVHFNSQGSGAMLTEEASFKSLQSMQD